MRVSGAVLFVEEPRAGARVGRAYRAARPPPLGRLGRVAFAVMRECSRWEPLDGQPPEADAALRGDRPGEARVADLVTRLGARVGQLTGGEVAR